MTRLSPSCSSWRIDSANRFRFDAQHFSNNFLQKNNDKKSLAVLFSPRKIKIKAHRRQKTVLTTSFISSSSESIFFDETFNSWIVWRRAIPAGGVNGFSSGSSLIDFSLANELIIGRSNKSATADAFFSKERSSNSTRSYKKKKVKNKFVYIIL